jgi:hypothetical protein
MANPERDITATPNKKCMLIKIFRFFEKKTDMPQKSIDQKSQTLHPSEVGDLDAMRWTLARQSANRPFRMGFP